MVYSNRSAAYLQLKEYGKALADANKIVESLDPEWSKGYVRRGDAYFALKDYTRAYNAYQRAERLDPSESAYKAKTEKALEWITYESQRNSTRSSANSGGFGSGNVGGAPFKGTACLQPNRTYRIDATDDAGDGLRSGSVLVTG